jgi:hypothetical protein
MVHKDPLTVSTYGVFLKTPGRGKTTPVIRVAFFIKYQ